MGTQIDVAAAGTGELLIDATIAAKLSFAAHHNDVPALRELRLVEPGKVPVEHVVVTAEADLPVFALRERRFYQIVGSGEMPVSRCDLPLNARLLLGLRKTVRGLRDDKGPRRRRQRARVSIGAES